MSAERPAAIPTLRPFLLVCDEDMAELERQISIIEVPSGTTLFDEGDSADGLAILLEGTVEIVKGKRVIATLGPGSVLGELALFTPSARRMATARTSSAVRMMRWDAEDLPSRLANNERLATSIVADLAFVIAERLDRRTQDVMALLAAAGSRLPVSELERFRSSAVE